MLLESVAAEVTKFLPAVADAVVLHADLLPNAQVLKHGEEVSLQHNLLYSL